MFALNSTIDDKQASCEVAVHLPQERVRMGTVTSFM